MFCSHCGAPNADADNYCARCGHPLAKPGPASIGPQTDAAPTEAATAASAVRYAGFWRRVGAYFIDYFIFVMAAFVLGFALAVAGSSDDAIELISVLFGFIGFWLYKALFESGAKQGTWGKQAVGIQVTDLQGRRIGFGRATGRYFATILSSLTLGIGYVMAAFTARRQTLHDIIAGTVVVHQGTQAGAAGTLPVDPRPMPGYAIVLIVLAGMIPITGILAAIAIPAYQDYTIRAQVHEGLNLASEYKAAVTEAWVETPMEFSEINSDSLGLDLDAASQYVAEIEVVSGAVVVTYGGAANAHIDGKSLVLVPAVNEDGELAWACGYGRPDAGYDPIFEDHGQYTDVEPKYLPAKCRPGSGDTESL